MTFDPDPLSLTGSFLTPPAFKNAILDSHLNTRDRMGRMLTFVSRLVAQVGTTGCPGGILSASTSVFNGARAIGVGVETALLVQGNGLQTPFVGRRVTSPYTTETDNAVYFVRPLQAATVCSPGKPFTAHQFEIRKLNDDGVLACPTGWQTRLHRGRDRRRVVGQPVLTASPCARVSGVFRQRIANPSTPRHPAMRRCWPGRICRVQGLLMKRLWGEACDTTCVPPCARRPPG